MILIGFFCAVSVTTLAITLGGPEKIQYFFDLPSIVLVVMTNAILILSSGKGRLFLRGMAETAAMGPPKTQEDGGEVAAFFRYLSIGNIYGGVFWVLIGVVLTLANLDPDTIGSGLAVCLLTVFYAVFISIFAYLPIRERFTASTPTSRPQ